MIEEETARHAIRARREASHPEPLFARALGNRFSLLPEPIRALHGATGGLTFSGQARVEWGSGPAVALVCTLFGLPRAVASCPVRVAILPDGTGSERWVRRFGDHAFASAMSLAPRGEERGLMRERFGPFTMELLVDAGDAGLDLTVTGWRLRPLPRRWRPTTRANGSTTRVGFRLDVTLYLPPLGRLVRYTGWLVPETGGTTCR